MVAEPERSIGSLDILGAEERASILRQWNDTAHTIALATLPELFAAQVAQTPDAIAVVFEDESLSYGELDRRANQLAHHLRGLGVGPEVVVGLCVERSLEMVVGLLGILKAGGAYLPLDPAYPPERLAFMLERRRRAGAGDAIGAARSAARRMAPASSASMPIAAIARAAHHGARRRARSAPSRLRHLHLGLHRTAERRRGRARGRSCNLVP